MGPTAGIDIIAKEEVPVTKQDATEDHVTWLRQQRYAMWRHEQDLPHSGQDSMGDDGKEPFGFHNKWQFLYHMSNHWPLKQDPMSWSDQKQKQHTDSAPCFELWWTTVCNFHLNSPRIRLPPSWLSVHCSCRLSMYEATTDRVGASGGTASHTNCHNYIHVACTTWRCLQQSTWHT
jgi:hypothetical protein